MTGRPMKVLHVGFLQGLSGYDRYYLIPQRLMNGFIRNGHVVYAFNDRDYARYSNIFRSRNLGARQVDRKLQEICRSMEPDLLFLSNCEMVTNEALEEIRAAHPHIHIAYRNVDPLNMVHNTSKIARRAGVVDTIFLTTDPACLDLQVSDRQTSGTRIFFMPNPVDASLDVGKSFARRDHDYDVFFAGGGFRHGLDTRRDTLDAVGNEFDPDRTGFFGSQFGRPALQGASYLDTLGRSRFGLSIDRVDDYHLYASDRMSHMLGNGLLTFARAGKGFEALVGEGSAAWFDSSDHLLDLIRHFKRSGEEWRRIAEKGHGVAHDIFSCQRVAQWIIETCFDLPHSQHYPWKDRAKNG